MVWTKHMHPHQSNGVAVVSEVSDKDWFMGSIFLIITTLSWASLFILQGIVTSNIVYYVQGTVIQKIGPVLASTFSPLMIIVAIMGSFILAERIYFGGVLGSVLIVAGLYSVMWGKYMENKEMKEMKEKEAMSLPYVVKDIEVIDTIELERLNGNKMVYDGSNTLK